MGHSFSPESITAAKLHYMASIVDKAEDIDWIGCLKTLFLQEHVKFSMTADNKLKLEKKVCNLGKVCVILKDKLSSNFRWDSNGLKQLKALMNIDEPLSGLLDHDPTPTIQRRGTKQLLRVLLNLLNLLSMLLRRERCFRKKLLLRG